MIEGLAGHADEAFGPQADDEDDQSSRICLMRLILSFLAALNSSLALGQLQLVLEDNEVTVRTKLANRSEILEARSALSDFKQSLRKFKERDFSRLFGAPVPPPEGVVLAAGEPASITLSGLRFKDERSNKHHISWYQLTNIGYLCVYFGINNGTENVVVYLRAGQDAPNLAETTVAQRLAWEQPRLAKIRAYLQQRRREVFRFELDPLALRNLLSDDDSIDIRAKLSAWEQSGECLGLRLEVSEATQWNSTQWRWYRENGTLDRTAYAYTGNSLPNVFVWFYPDGNTYRRYESGSPERLQFRRWHRPDASIIYYELWDDEELPGATLWCWFDENGSEYRCERDSNGDGIPDLVGQKRSDHDPQALRVEESWIVRPELIPIKSRVNAQQLPLRKIQ